MWPSLKPALFSFLSSVLLTRLCLSSALRKGWLVRPRADRWSHRAVAKFGGVGIVLSFISTAAILPMDPPLRIVVLLTLLTGLFGLLDDLRPLNAKWKLSGQMFIAALAVYSGLIWHLTLIPIVDGFCTMLWLLALTNGFNLLDNMDGLTAGVGAIAACSLAWIAHVPSAAAAILTVSMAGCLLGFLLFNFHPARIFMGDSGSEVIGFFLACSALIAAKQTVALHSMILVLGLILFLPIFDLALVSVTRAVHGRAISIGAKDHTSHRLVFLGMSERGAVFTLYLTSGLGSVIACVWKNMAHGSSALMVFLIGALLLWLYLAVLELPEDWLPPLSTKSAI